MDTEAMVWETLELSSRFEESQLPTGAGIIYRLDRSGGTFCLRGFSCRDVGFSLKQLESGNPTLLGFLRLQGCDRPLQEVAVFKTGSPEMAEMVFEQLFNRRFPIVDESLCNLSDTGFGWWLICTENRLRLFFSGHKPLGETDKAIKLGPIGDRAVAALLFVQMETWLSDLLPVSAFSLSDKCLDFSTSEPGHPVFCQLAALFEQGQWPFEEQQFPTPTLALYLQELATIRRFWIEIETLVWPPTVK